MKLLKLTLNSFQDHYNSVFEFGTTFTCIIGSTNSGKSSLARALTFLFYGDWVDDYISHGTQQTTVIAEFDNGITITRIKGGGGNDLILKQGDKEQKLEKVGRTLPAEFYQLLPMSPIPLEGDRELYLNIANQDDPYFLLTETGPTKNKILGKLAGLHIADAAIKGLSTDRKALSTERIQLNDQITETTVQLQEFVQLSRQQDTVITLEEKIKVIQEKETDLQQLYSIRTRIEQWKRRKEDLQLLKARAALPDTVDLLNSAKRWKLLQEKETKLQEQMASLQTMQQAKTAAQAEYNVAKDKYASALSSQSQCPICETTITPQVVDRLVSKL